MLNELGWLMRSKGDIEWCSVSNSDLTRHIIDFYHASLRSTMPEVIRLARQVEAMHADHAECPAGLGNVLSQMWEELECHMEQEESILFPMLSEHWGVVEACGLVRQMMVELNEHGAGLAEIRRICNDFEWPTNGGTTWKALYLSLGAWEEELMEHIHLENNVLFKRVIVEANKFLV